MLVPLISSSSTPGLSPPSWRFNYQVNIRGLVCLRSGDGPRHREGLGNVLVRENLQDRGCCRQQCLRVDDSQIGRELQLLTYRRLANSERIGNPTLMIR